MEEMLRRNQKGITLLALVITVVIMLILAAIGIKLAIGDNGILNNTKQANEDTKESYVKEIIHTSYNAILIDYEISRRYSNRILGRRNSRKR